MNQEKEMENVIQLSFVNQEKERNVIMSLKDAYDFNEPYEIENTELIIKEDVQLLHFKNFYFSKITTIKCLNQDTIVILEQCHFLKSMVLINGCITILSPQFDNLEGKYLLYNLKFFQNTIAELIHEKTNKRNFAKNIYHIQNVNELKISGDMGNAILVNSNNPTFKMKKFSIKNAINYHGCKFLVEKVEIENSQVEGIENLECEELQIKKSTIYPEPNSDTINLSHGKITIEESALYGQKILLSNTTCIPKNGMLRVTTTKETKESLLEARMQLINCLKEVLKENSKSVRQININQRSMEQTAHLYTHLKNNSGLKPKATNLYFETSIAPNLRREMLLINRKI